VNAVPSFPNRRQPIASWLRLELALLVGHSALLAWSIARELGL